MLILLLFLAILGVKSEDPYLFFTWNVTYGTLSPLGKPQQVILINDQFPGPVINSTSNNNVVVNLFNNLDEPFLLTWYNLWFPVLFFQHRIWDVYILIEFFAGAASNRGRILGRRVCLEPTAQFPLELTTLIIFKSRTKLGAFFTTQAHRFTKQMVHLVAFISTVVCSFLSLMMLLRMTSLLLLKSVRL